MTPQRHNSFVLLPGPPRIAGKGNALALLLVCLNLALGASCRRSRDIELDPYHPEVLQAILDGSSICPSGYQLIHVPNLFRAMGMTENPGFITNASEVEAMSRFGGSDPFLAVYGSGDTICMMVNGVFFRDPARVDAFVQDQEKRSRLRVAVYEKATEKGAWVIVCAIDPARTYSAEERTAILDALERQARNLQTRLRFNRLWDD